MIIVVISHFSLLNNVFWDQRDMLKSRKSGLILPILIPIFLFALVPAEICAKDSAKNHGDIIHDALGSDFQAKNLAVLEAGSDSQLKPGSEASTDARRHFFGGDVIKSIAAMDRQRKLILDYAADSNSVQKDRVRTLFYIGALIHSAQDFYFYTNYVEVTMSRAKDRGLELDPYAVPLADWSRLINENSKEIIASSEFAKDDADSKEGKIAWSDSNYYKVAKELATKETSRQWSVIQALLRQRYGSKSDEIISALKQAECPPKVKSEDLIDN